ncbi:MAG: chromosomal replication initiator DnaA [Caulobacteraceae bacterium]|nr:chromosomal replication initiator DnaA [Caulobacteraceae bacterium]
MEETGWRAPVAESDRTRMGLAMQLIAVTFDVPLTAMSGSRLTPKACKARYLAVYLAHVGYGWTLDRVSLAFGINRATAGSACRWSEDARDNPVLDAALDRMEQTLRQICDTPRLELSLGGAA